MGWQMCRCPCKNGKRMSAIRKDGKKLNIPSTGEEDEAGLAMEADVGWVGLLGRREDGGTVRVRITVVQPKDQRDHLALTVVLLQIKRST